MIRRLLLASLLAVQPTPSTSDSIAPQPVVPLVVCLHPTYYNAGTAFRVGPHLLLSVAHVTSSGGCQIDGQSIHILYTSSSQDFSILSDDRSGEFIPVDCNGFVKGRKYLSIGHARGIENLTIVPMIATGVTEGGLAILAGVFTAQPGMSGGPIVDAETMKVVGTTNTGDWERGLTGSVELKGTSVCQR